MPARGFDGFPGRRREAGGLFQFLAGESDRPPDAFHFPRIVGVEHFAHNGYRPVALM